MASNYSQDQYYSEYLKYVKSFTRLYNEVPPSFQNYLTYQKQEAMTVKSINKKKQGLQLVQLKKKLFNQTQKRERWSAKQTEALVKLWKENLFTRNAKVCHGMAKSQSRSKRARPRKDRNTM